MCSHKNRRIMCEEFATSQGIEGDWLNGKFHIYYARCHFSNREVLYNNVKSEIQNFENIPDVENFTIILLHFEKPLIRYLHNSLNIRQNIINK